MDRRTFLGIDEMELLPASSVSAKDIEVRDHENDDVFQPIRNLIANKEPIIWVFIGASVTQGALHTYGWKSYVEHFQERIRTEMKRMTDIVINSGISGDTMKGVLARDEWRIFQFKPNVISLMIGLNDCRDGEKGRDNFRISIEKLVEKAKQREALILLHTPNPIDISKAPERADVLEYVKIVREIAHQYKLPLVDHYAYWTKEVGDGARFHMWLNDGSLHPNNYGHIVLARKIFQDLGIFDEKSITCARLFVP